MSVNKTIQAYMEVEGIKEFQIMPTHREKQVLTLSQKIRTFEIKCFSHSFSNIALQNKKRILPL